MVLHPTLFQLQQRLKRQDNKIRRILNENNFFNCCHSSGDSGHNWVPLSRLLKNLEEY